MLRPLRSIIKLLVRYEKFVIRFVRYDKDSLYFIIYISFYYYLFIFLFYYYFFSWKTSPRSGRSSVGSSLFLEFRVCLEFLEFFHIGVKYMLQVNTGPVSD